MTKIDFVFAPQPGEKIINLIVYHDRILVACTDGLWELFEEHIGEDNALICNKKLMPDEKRDIPELLKGE